MERRPPKEEPTPVTFGDLPYEIWLMIFSLLKVKDLLVAARICKKWKKMAYDPSLWKRIEISYWPRQYEYYDGFALVEDIRRCTMLKSFTLSGGLLNSNLVNILLQSICGTFKNLEELTISGYYDLSDESMVSVSELHRLKVLVLPERFRRQLHPEYAVFVTRGCRSLETLHLGGIILNDCALAAVVCCLKNTLICLDMNCEKTTDDGLRHLRKLHHLQSLSLSSCIHMTDEGLRHLTLLPRLKIFSLEKNDKLTSQGILDFLDSSLAVQLEILKLRWIHQVTDECLKRAMHRCLHLKKLVLFWLYNVNDSAVEDARSAYKCDIQYTKFFKYRVPSFHSEFAFNRCISF